MKAAIVQWLDQWQTLVGSFIGGIVGWVAATIVARDARKREERASAMVVMYDVFQLAALGDNFKRSVEGKSEVDAALYVTARLMELYPQLSPLTEISIFRISHIDDNLSAHLAHFHRIYKLVIEMVEKERKLGPQLTMPLAAEFLEQCRTLWTLFQRVSEHAVCASHLLDSFILGKRTTVIVNRARRRVGRFNYGNNCVHILDTGEIRKEPAQAK